jgi:hypothetical protein
MKISVIVVGLLGCLSYLHANEKSTFARFVPERKDDFAWENDKIAFRMYGPALRDKKENAGIDCWLKRVEYPIINKWYKEKAYHDDTGEGHDCYHVGSSAGCGGTALWLNGKREALNTYIKQEVIEVTKERSSFKLTYERTIGDDVYGEEKTITIELGKRLFRADSLFTKNGKPAVGLPLCIGLTTHNGRGKVSSDLTKGWISCWEDLKGHNLGTAAMIDPAKINSIKEIGSKKEKDTSHIIILAKTDNSGKITYYAGYGWAKAKEITTELQWHAYLNTYKKGQ